MVRKSPALTGIPVRLRERAVSTPLNSDATSLRRFDWLIEQRGYRFTTESDLEAVISVRDKRPDYFVDTLNGVQFLAEVKAFEKRTALGSSEGTAAIFLGDSQSRINRGPIVRASKQLARYAGHGLPLVVVLDNYRQVGIDLDSVALIQIFGSIGYEMTVDTGSGRLVDGSWAHSNDDYALGDRRRPHISAVLVNIATQRFEDDGADDFSVQRPMRAHVIHNPDATHPLPLWVFSAPDDKQIIRHEDRWIELQCPPANISHRAIEQRAFDLFERRAGADGSALRDWLDAERSTRDEAAQIPSAAQS